MTEEEIKRRLIRIYTAFSENTGLDPIQIPLTVHRSGTRVSFYQDLSGGRHPSGLVNDATDIINGIMGLYDRTKTWLKPIVPVGKPVDDFLDSNYEAALVHDLANTDKHGELNKPTRTGRRPTLGEVSRRLAPTYDAASGTYVQESVWIGPSINTETLKIEGGIESHGFDVVLVADISDEYGNKMGDLQKVLPDALYQWESFLASQGMALP